MVDKETTLHDWHCSLDSKDSLHQFRFFRRIAALFASCAVTTDSFNKFCTIIDWHTSKSIRLPVYHLVAPNIEIIARSNFYNWNVTIISQYDLDIPTYFAIDDGRAYFFAEGMGSYKREKYADDKKEFSFCVFNDYDLYAIMKCIASQQESLYIG